MGNSWKIETTATFIDGENLNKMFYLSLKRSFSAHNLMNTQNENEPFFFKFDYIFSLDLFKVIFLM